MAGEPSIVAYVVTCAERRAIFEETLGKFRGTDWGGDPDLQLDDGAAPDKLARIHATWLKALERVAGGAADFGLILEDDLDFNVHLRRNLTGWGPLQGRDGNAPFFGSIYNADNRPASWRDPNLPFFIAHPRQFWGAQAILVSRLMASYFLKHWAEEAGNAATTPPHEHLHVGLSPEAPRCLPRFPSYLPYTHVARSTLFQFRVCSLWRRHVIGLTLQTTTNESFLLTSGLRGGGERLHERKQVRLEQDVAARRIPF